MTMVMSAQIYLFYRGEFFDVELTFAAEVDDFSAGDRAKAVALSCDTHLRCDEAAPKMGHHNFVVMRWTANAAISPLRLA